jgi:hypothetical protein
MLDPDPHKTDADPKHCFERSVLAWIRIRIEQKMLDPDPY